MLVHIDGFKGTVVLGALLLAGQIWFICRPIQIIKKPSNHRMRAICTTAMVVSVIVCLISQEWYFFILGIIMLADALMIPVWFVPLGYKLGVRCGSEQRKNH